MFANIVNGNGYKQEKVAKAAAGVKLEDDDNSPPSAGPSPYGEGTDIKVATFDELVLDAAQLHDVQAVWESFVGAAESREAVGEAIYGALFDSAPSLMSLFTTPRAVQAMRFMNALSSFVGYLDSPAQLKAVVETLGFGHLNIEVTVPRVVVFRDAIVDLLDVELGDEFTEAAREGWKALLNYVGGALIFIKSHYADRLRILSDSWRSATKRGVPGQQAPQNTELGRGMGLSGEHSGGKEELGGSNDRPQEDSTAVKSPKKRAWTLAWGRSRKAKSRSKGGADSPRGNSPRGDGDGEVKNKAVGTTYEEMFQFNAAVMGITGKAWLKEVLACFDTIVTHVANSTRLSQECDVLALRISKCKGGSSGVNLNEYRACMLASLRSLLPKAWDSAHEVAWNWLWENVERLLRKTLGHPPLWEVALDRLWNSISDAQQFEIRKAVYERFFAAAPIGQDYFKQSTTRLHFIAERVFRMSVELIHDPWHMVDEVSALGLRHVGYGIPTELFGPFVTAYIQVIVQVSQDVEAIEAFRWSLGLISKMLVQTITEGSTIVMKAINVNSEKGLKRAVSCATRGERAKWLLIVQVGTQSISPLSWALQSGSHAAAQAILTDLLTIRADRERYYYGVEDLFQRHPDIVERLCAESQALLFTFLDGLVWRSRLTKDGLRRANYYVKYLIVNAEGEFSDALQHLFSTRDPKTMSHPVVHLISDTLWSGIVSWQFVSSKIWFMVSLFLFMMGEAILPKIVSEGDEYNLGIHVIIFVCRLGNYLLTMPRLLFVHTRGVVSSVRRREYQRVLRCRIPVPVYLLDPYNATGYALGGLLAFMCANEPMFYCFNTPTWPTEVCENSEGIFFAYSFSSMLAVALHWFLLIDLAVFNTGLSAFVIVCVHVLSEIGRFFVAFAFLLMTFGSAISVLDHSYECMQTTSGAVVALFSITLYIWKDDYRDLTEDPVLVCMVFIYIASSSVLLLNLLIAQLNCTYVYIYQNMFGFARLKRAEVIVETLASCPWPKWERFVASLELDKPLDFNEGDVGMAGGLTVWEPANLHVVTEDSIQRFGGTCSPDEQWPDENADDQEEIDKFERMERLIQRTLKKIATARTTRPRAKAGASFSFGSKLSSGSSLSISMTGAGADGSESSDSVR